MNDAHVMLADGIATVFASAMRETVKGLIASSIDAEA
jgi:hypothetical protein